MNQFWLFVLWAEYYVYCLLQVSFIGGPFLNFSLSFCLFLPFEWISMLSVWFKNLNCSFNKCERLKYSHWPLAMVLCNCMCLELSLWLVGCLAIVDRCSLYFDKIQSSSRCISSYLWIQFAIDGLFDFISLKFR